VAYGRVFEDDNPEAGDWYYVGPPDVLRDVSEDSVPPNAAPIGRGLGIGGLDPLDGTTWSFQVIVGPGTTTTTTTSSTSTSSTSSTTLRPPVIVDVDPSVTLWAVYQPGGTITPMYSTNLETIPIDWIPISVFSNTLVSGTNVFEFEKADTNASLIYFRLTRD
jgi:hypothetical protein